MGPAPSERRSLRTPRLGGHWRQARSRLRLPPPLWRRRSFWPTPQPYNVPARSESLRRLTSPTPQGAIQVAAFPAPRWLLSRWTACATRGSCYESPVISAEGAGFHGRCPDRGSGQQLHGVHMCCAEQTRGLEQHCGAASRPSTWEARALTSQRSICRFVDKTLRVLWAVCAGYSVNRPPNGSGHKRTCRLIDPPPGRAP